MCACESKIRSGRGSASSVAAGATKRFNPSVTGPIRIPILELKTGSVRTVNPSMLKATVLCPTHVACRPSVGQPATFGVRGAGSTGRLTSSLTRSKKRGAALRANAARPPIPAIYSIGRERSYLRFTRYSSSNPSFVVEGLGNERRLHTASLPFVTRGAVARAAPSEKRPNASRQLRECFGGEEKIGRGERI